MLQEPEEILQAIAETPAARQDVPSRLLERRKTLAQGKLTPRASLLRRLTLPTSLRRNSLAPKEEPAQILPTEDSMVSSPTVATPMSGEPPTTAGGSVSGFHSHRLDEVGTAGHPAVYACDRVGWICNLCNLTNLTSINLSGWNSLHQAYDPRAGCHQWRYTTFGG